MKAGLRKFSLRKKIYEISAIVKENGIVKKASQSS